jgi:hypothetical protein
VAVGWAPDGHPATGLSTRTWSDDVSVTGAGTRATRPVSDSGKTHLGKLIYGANEIDIDDLLLMHLQVVAINRLRRDKPFAMSWRDSRDSGGGRTTVWVHPSIPLMFHFDGSRIPAINKLWLDELYASADGPTGLILTAEPAADGEASGGGVIQRKATEGVGRL